MTEQTLEERRKAAYGKLAEVVQEMSDLDEADSDCRNSIPTSWALVVGYEVYDESLDDVGGAVGIYPKGGCQPQWKSVGILTSALNRMKR